MECLETMRTSRT